MLIFVPIVASLPKDTRTQGENDKNNKPNSPNPRSQLWLFSKKKEEKQGENKKEIRYRGR